MWRSVRCVGSTLWPVKGESALEASAMLRCYEPLSESLEDSLLLCHVRSNPMRPFGPEHV
jgi:hypothetical protein